MASTEEQNIEEVIEEIIEQNDPEIEEIDDEEEYENKILLDEGIENSVR